MEPEAVFYFYLLFLFFLFFLEPVFILVTALFFSLFSCSGVWCLTRLFFTRFFAGAIFFTALVFPAQSFLRALAMRCFSLCFSSGRAVAFCYLFVRLLSVPKAQAF
ncbi:hypothetical protein J4441_00950 [Candidatus Micrarchaeota archaeon]|nr:hypothetical protein [Candidatus Micrarchaeota archaeon]